MGEFNQQKYVNEYTKEKYDRISINVKKGKRKEIEKHYKNKGYQSMNSYVNHLIDQDIEKSNGRSNQGGGIVIWKMQKVQHRKLPQNMIQRSNKFIIS